ncbi:hypothetical protein VDIAB_30042 [Vibrio diabolicus]|nr:hypothetical protein VDIAB_30042 [Vibrio diabolicus]
MSSEERANLRICEVMYTQLMFAVNTISYLFFGKTILKGDFGI